MLDNKFDQFFRDRLLDHSSKIPLSMWKRVHTHLLQHKTFRFWRWPVAAPAAVVVAITAHFILATHHSTPISARSAAATATSTTAPHETTANSTGTPSAVATYDHRPAGDSPKTTALGDHPPIANPPIANRPITNPPITNRPIENAPTSSQRFTTARFTSTAKTADRANHHRHDAGLATNNSNVANETNPEDPLVEKTSPSTTTNQPIVADQNSIHPPIPAQGIAPAKLASLKKRPAVAANSPDPKSPHKLSLPTKAFHLSDRLYLDAVISPEYWTSRLIGISYGAGVRATMVFKDHWTITSGLEYLKVNVNPNKDTFNGPQQGYFQNIHVPLFLGYTAGFRHMTYSVYAGAIISFSQTVHGRLSRNSFPGHGGPSAVLGMNFSSPLTDRLSFLVSPYLKRWYPPNNGNILPSHFWSTGLSVGIRYSF